MVRAQSITATLVYTYNHSGLRVAQSVDGNPTSFSWDWATGIPEMLSAGDALYLVGHETLGQYVGSAWTYYLPDALGSVRQAADSVGAVVSAREWSPYGIPLRAGGEVVAAQGAPQAGLGYTGEWFDDSTGMVYLRARWYDVDAGRFLTEDSFPGTIFLPPTQHAYFYAANNPMLWTDPTGLCPPGMGQICEGIAQDINLKWGVEIDMDHNPYSAYSPRYMSNLIKALGRYPVCEKNLWTPMELAYIAAIPIMTFLWDKIPDLASKCLSYGAQRPF